MAVSTASAVPGAAPEEARHKAVEAAAHLAEAARLIGTADRALAAFFAGFTRYAAPEDLLHYTGAELAALVRLVFARTRSRPPGTTLIETFDPAAEDPAFAQAETVLVAVNDDVPFLYDSCIAEVRAQGIDIRAVFHPVLSVARRADGWHVPGDAGSRESIIVLAVELIHDPRESKRVVDGLAHTFAQVRLAVRDWRAMLDRLNETVAGLKSHPPPIPEAELGETIAFLSWLGDNHFTFLGARDYRYDGAGDSRLEARYGSGLGLLSDPKIRVIRRSADRTSLTPEVREFFTQPAPLIITKTNMRSPVHRPVHMDYIGVKTFDANGTLIGERRFIGLFTSTAYSALPADIPLLRRKTQHVLASSGLPHDSHDGKALGHILDVFPRDELFQIGEDELLATALGILNLGDRPRVRVFLRFDKFDRFVSAFVFVPRDRYNTEIRERIHAILARSFDGRMSASYPYLDEEALARVLFIVGRNHGPRPEADVKALENEIAEAIRTWKDGLSDALVFVHGEDEGAHWWRRYADAFPPGYRDHFDAAEAVDDIEKIEAVLAGRGACATLSAQVYRHDRDPHDTFRLKLFATGGFVPLSDCLPLFENLGLRVIAEDSFAITPRGTAEGQSVAVQDFLMRRAEAAPAALRVVFARLRPLLEDSFHAVWAGLAESDGFNRLVGGAEMNWRDVTILRAVAKFLRQAGFSLSQPYMELALAKNPGLAALLVRLFRTLHDPDAFAEGAAREAAAKKLRGQIDAALDEVPSADDDRIIRTMRAVVDAMLRVSFFQIVDDGRAKAFLAFKLASRMLDLIPAPRPLYEIFVYAPEVEGVHLRFGKVARGGIRWSDRPEDFRTEILSLVKAQQVKNAVIVPVGAKGGFYPKRVSAGATREEMQKIGVAAYKTFIGALLDLTDNIGADGAVIPPARTLRYDDDDPYLVVAADKGTATFSDTANALAEERAFWLGDAFASGGSQGYDHKQMGITARGAWEAIKRHFRELGRDIQTEPFSCVGVGDMSGDVFGNGMLLSKATRLVAAFDHRHIFFDPDPDPAASWSERKRLFDLPRSSWANYDKTLLSPGGGVFARTAKEIPLNNQLKAVTGLLENAAPPADVIRALLKAEVDLLFFGGIGTYIKAAAQRQSDAGDKTNDALRVDGRDVRARVVGEGANLGVTQLGRVEYASQGGPERKGGRIDTDAVDNSAGVDTSDHEVNLKILMSGPLRRGALTVAARNALLTEMTQAVASLVLKDNYDQTEALSVAEARAPRDVEAALRLMRDLEQDGRLDRSVEDLPTDEALRSRVRAGRGLTRPELAVLLAYAKLDTFDGVIDSDLPDDPYLQREMTVYFPTLAAARFSEELKTHRLRREIVATQIVNKMINLAGPLYVHRLRELSAAPAARVARAFAIAEAAFGLESLKSRIDALDLKIAAARQIGLSSELVDLSRRLGLWFAANLPETAEIGSSAQTYGTGAARLKSRHTHIVSAFEAEEIAKRAASLAAEGVPGDLAGDIALFAFLGAVPEIVLLAQTSGRDVEESAHAFFAMGTTLGLDRLRAYAASIADGDYWDRLALTRIVDDLFALQRVLAGQALALGSGAEAVTAWSVARAAEVAHTRASLDDLSQDGPANLARLALASSQIQIFGSKSAV